MDKRKLNKIELIKKVFPCTFFPFTQLNLIVWFGLVAGSLTTPTVLVKLA